MNERIQNNSRIYSYIWL